MKTYWNLLYIACILMFAACSGNDGNNAEDPENPDGLTGTLVLEASASYIENNGTDAVLFTVKKGSTDVTSEAKIYVKSGSEYTDLKGTSFTSKTTGEYTFFASYKTEQTVDVTVTVTSGMLALPEDKNPDKFDGFKQQVLGVQVTSLGCTYCPLMIAGLTEFAKLEEATSTVLVAAHGIMDGDDMINKYSEALIKGMSINAAPTLRFNLDSNHDVAVTSTSPASVASQIQVKASELLKEGAGTAISLATAGSESSGLITVTAAVKVGIAGSYRICAWIVEDNVYATGQLNSYPSLEGLYDFTHHSNVLRCISSTSPITGVNLGGKTACAAGETLPFQYEFKLSDMTIASLANARVVVVVSKNTSGQRYVVDNVVSCKLNSQLAFEYK